MSPIKTELIEITAKRPLNGVYTIEYSIDDDDSHHRFNDGSPKWIRWLAKYLPFIKVRESTEELIIEKLANQIREDIDKEVMETLCAELKKDA